MRYTTNTTLIIHAAKLHCKVYSPHWSEILRSLQATHSLSSKHIENHDMNMIVSELLPLSTIHTMRAQFQLPKQFGVLILLPLCCSIVGWVGYPFLPDTRKYLLIMSNYSSLCSFKSELPCLWRTFGCTIYHQHTSYNNSHLMWQTTHLYQVGSYESSEVLLAD